MKKSISYSSFIFFPSEFKGFVWYEDLESEDRGQPCLGLLCRPVHDFSHSFYVLDCCYSYQGASDAVAHLFESIHYKESHGKRIGLIICSSRSTLNYLRTDFIQRHKLLLEKKRN